MKRILILICCMIMFLTGCGNSTPDERMGEPETREIKSCILDSEVLNKAHGSFVLGVGTYSSSSSISTKYYIYIKGNEGFRLQEIYSDNLEIVETNDIDPCIKGYFSENGKVYHNELDIDCYDAFSDNISDFEKFCEYIIYVPIGTIKEKYSSDIMEIVD